MFGGSTVGGTEVGIQGPEAFIKGDAVLGSNPATDEEEEKLWR